MGRPHLTWASVGCAMLSVAGTLASVGDHVQRAGGSCPLTAEVNGLRLDRGPLGDIALDWDVLDDPCLAAGPERYRIYASSTPVPLTAPGAFPNDPSFGLVGTSDTEHFSYAPPGDDRFLLVTGVAEDGTVGPCGHYETGCPCFDVGEIDHDVDYLVNLRCTETLPDSLQLRGSRGPDPGALPGSPNVWIASVGPGNLCEFHDGTHGFHRSISNLTSDEVAECDQRLRSSLMFSRNHCPPDGEVPTLGCLGFPNTNYTLAPDESDAHTIVICNTGNTALAVQLSEEPAAPWFAFSPAAVTYGPGDGGNGEIAVDSSGLSGGTYSTTLRVATNDPAAPLLERSISLTVVAPPEIAVSPSMLDFGTVPVDTERTLDLEVSNLGDATLEVALVSTSGPPFITITPEFTVPAGESRGVSVSCFPEDLGDFEGSATFISNDPDDASFTVSLRCTAIP